MNIGTMQFYSKALGRHTSYTVILPDQNAVGPGPYSVLIQLHGASDDHTAWTNRSNLFRYASNLPLIVVMPDGLLSFWINHNPKERYEDFLNQDLPEHLRSVYNIKEGKFAIGGLSMGGYGALWNGLSHPELYCSVWAHSSACFSKADFAKMGIGGIPQNIDYADLFQVAERVDKSIMPVLSFDVGTEDFLLEQNRRFNDHLNSLEIPHTYREHPGQHEWGYWDTHVQEALEQHARVLGISK